MRSRFLIKICFPLLLLLTISAGGRVVSQQKSGYAAAQGSDATQLAFSNDDAATGEIELAAVHACSAHFQQPAPRKNFIPAVLLPHTLSLLHSGNPIAAAQNINAITSRQLLLLFPFHYFW